MSEKEFSDVTGVSIGDAAHWLEMANYDLYGAIDLYYAEKSSTKKIAPYSAVEDTVRVPDSVKRQRIVDDSTYIGTQATKRITSTFTSGKDFKPQNDKEKTLAMIFVAPLDIMTQKGFEEALELAKTEDKWLLINIQNDSEFRCHALNRDFWSDEGVKDMVSCSFIFWQNLDVSVEGENFVQRYKVKSYPHLSIIDPRTGAMVWKYNSDNFQPKLLAEKVQDFLGANAVPSEFRRSNSFKLFGSNLIGNSSCNNNNTSNSKTGLYHNSNASTSSSSSNSSERYSFDVDDNANDNSYKIYGDEDENSDELAAAIQMSLMQQQHEVTNKPVPLSIITQDNLTSISSGSSSNASNNVKKDNDGCMVNTTTASVAVTTTSVQARLPGFSVNEVLAQSQLQSVNKNSISGGGEGDVNSKTTIDFKATSNIRLQIRLPVATPQGSSSSNNANNNNNASSSSSHNNGSTVKHNITISSEANVLQLLQEAANKIREDFTTNSKDDVNFDMYVLFPKKQYLSTLCCNYNNYGSNSSNSDNIISNHVCSNSNTSTILQLHELEHCTLQNIGIKAGTAFHIEYI